MISQDKINNTVVSSEEIQSNDILGIYNKDDNSFISIKVNEGRNIETAQVKKSIFDACKKLYEYEELNKVDNNNKLTNVFSLDKSIFVKVKGVKDEQIYDELSKYEKEDIVNENMLNDKPNIYVRLFNYENDYNVPEQERLILVCDELGKDKDLLGINKGQEFFDIIEESINEVYKKEFKYVGRKGVTEEQINNRLVYFDKASELITNLIKDDKLIEKFMIIVNIKGKEEAYIDDATHNGVTEGAVQFLSRQEQIDKIMSTLITFKDPVIVNSKEELEKLQAEFREAHGKKLVNKSEKSEVNSKKAELLKLMDGQNTRGYIRISHEDYLDAKILIEEMNIPFIAKESGIKVGMNIIVPIDKIQELKNMLLENNNTILQQVEGNIDWNKIKEIQGIRAYGNVSIEELKDFQNVNKDSFKYIAFEKDGRYSVYMEPSCSIIIKGDKIVKQEKSKSNDKKTLKDVNKMKDDYKKSKEEVTTTINEKNNNRGER